MARDPQMKPGVPALKRLLLVLLAILPLHILAVHAAPAPAGYIVSMTLAGEDVSAKTAVVRAGKELPPKLMMPVYAGDVVFLRDKASAISLELGDGSTVAIGGTVLRYNVQGEIPTGDDAWSVLTAIGTVLAGGEEVAPVNMVSKGDGDPLAVPLAVRGTNFVPQNTKQLWLSWAGGTGPFTLTIKVGEAEWATQTVKDREATFTIPKDGDGRFSVVIADSGHERMTVRFRAQKDVPQLPTKIKASAPGKTAGLLLRAAWLSEQAKGSWRVTAAQQLHAAKNAAAAELLVKLEQGWKLQ